MTALPNSISEMHAEAVIKLVQDLEDRIEYLEEHIKTVERSHALLLASRNVEGPL